MTQNQAQDLIGQLNEIRGRQGKDPIDGTKIEGGPFAPPPFDPVAARLAEARSYPEEHLETPEPQTFDDESPLVAIAKPEFLGKFQPDTFSSPDVAGHGVAPIVDFELLVMEHSATYRGRPVTLLDSERSLIVGIVLKALRRSLDEQYAEIAGTRMRTRKVREPEAPKRKRTPRESSKVGVAS